MNTVGLLPFSKLIQKLDYQLRQTTDLFLHRLSLFASFLGETIQPLVEIKSRFCNREGKRPALGGRCASPLVKNTFREN